jgi:hypothetical protein
MDHLFHKCLDAHCNVCKGDLQSCELCGQAEGTLQETCPGAKVAAMYDPCALVVRHSHYQSASRVIEELREELRLQTDRADKLGEGNARLVEAKRVAVHRAESLELRVEGLLGSVAEAERERDEAVESMRDESLYVNDLIGAYAREHAIAETLARAVEGSRWDVMKWIAADILRPEAKAMFEGVKEKHGLRLTSWPVSMMAEYFVELLDSRPDAPNYASFFVKVPGKGPDDDARELTIHGQWRSGQTPAEVAEVDKHEARRAEAERDDARAKMADMHTAMRECLLDIERRALACTSLLAKCTGPADARVRLRFKGAGYMHAAELLSADLARFEAVVFDIQVSRRESADA